MAPRSSRRGESLPASSSVSVNPAVDLVVHRQTSFQQDPGLGPSFSAGMTIASNPSSARPRLRYLNPANPSVQSSNSSSPVSESSFGLVGMQPFVPHYGQAGVSRCPPDYQNTAMSMPVVPMAGLAGWPSYEGIPQDFGDFGHNYEDQQPTPVGIDTLNARICGQSTHCGTDTSVPTAYSYVEQSEPSQLLPGSVIATTVVGAGTPEVVSLDGEVAHHYYECYWKYFHPLYPIIHRPTFTTAGPPTLLHGIMLAIGAQFSHRSEARSHSVSWFISSLSLCNLVCRP